MNFSEALIELKAGYMVCRSGWNGKGMWIEHHMPSGAVTSQYLAIHYPVDAVNTPGAVVPWLPSQTDILAEDWAVAE